MALATERNYQASVQKWHGLGKPIHATNVEDAITEAGMDWQISKHELKTVSTNPELDGLQLTRHFPIIREDTKVVLGVLGRGYTTIQNKDALQMFQDVLDTNEITLEQGGEFDEGRRLWMVSRLPQELKIGPDEIDRHIIINWSHDGSLALTAAFVPYLRRRHVALTAPVKGMPMSVAIKHTKNNKERINESSKMLKKAYNYFAEASEVFQRMVDEPFGKELMGRYLQMLFPDKELVENKDGSQRKNSNESKRAEIMDIFCEPSDVSETKWAAFTSVADWADHSRKGRTPDGSNPTELRLEGIWFGTAAKIKANALEILQNDVI